VSYLPFCCISQALQAVSQSGLGGPGAELQDRGNLLNREIVEVVQDQHSPTGGRYLIQKVTHFCDENIRFQRGIHGQLVNVNVFCMSESPETFLPKECEAGTSANPIGPSSNELRFTDQSQVPADLEEDILQHILRCIWTD
jgi:hypothetical protein